jgi:plastocyanin
MLTRRAALGLGGGFVANVGFSNLVRVTAAEFIEIHMKSDSGGGVVGFDPIGVLLQPGQTVRWICDDNVHTATAYSPKNDNHSLRIPTNAQPWASDFLLPKQTFEVTLTIEGIYDYFCAPHEEAGMVGRLIVGSATGPGAQPYDYYLSQGRNWKSVPPAAQKSFPTIEAILAKKVVRSPLNFSKMPMK